MSNFTTVPDKSVGDTFTELMWDTYLRDNLNKGVVRPLADSKLGAPAANFDLTSIDQNFGALLLVSYVRGDAVAGTIAVQVRFNNDSGANYDAQSIHNSAATTAAAGENLAATSGMIDRGVSPGGSAAASEFGVVVTLIPAYTDTVGQKGAISIIAGRSGTASGNLSAMLCATFWRSTAAVNRITILPSSGNFVTGSRVTLYGLAF
jgi:hypothetical protein